LEASIKVLEVHPTPNRKEYTMEEERFVVQAEHIKLVKRFNVWWEDCEFGAPAIDCKRPYGNSDVTNDIAEILGWEQFEDEDGEMHLSREQGELARRLHKEMETVLQILCANADEGLSEGPYCKPFLGNWGPGG